MRAGKVCFLLLVVELHADALRQPGRIVIPRLQLLKLDLQFEPMIVLVRPIHDGFAPASVEIGMI